MSERYTVAVTKKNIAITMSPTGHISVTISLYLTKNFLNPKNTMTFQTEFQREKEQRDMQIYQEFVTLTAEPGAAVSKVQEFLMKKYGIHSSSTLWSIRKRVEAKLRKGGKK